MNVNVNVKKKPINKLLTYSPNKKNVWKAFKPSTFTL